MWGFPNLNLFTVFLCFICGSTVQRILCFYYCWWIESVLLSHQLSRSWYAKQRSERNITALLVCKAQKLCYLLICTLTSLNKSWHYKVALTTDTMFSEQCQNSNSKRELFLKFLNKKTLLLRWALFLIIQRKESSWADVDAFEAQPQKLCDVFGGQSEWLDVALGDMV